MTKIKVNKVSKKYHTETSETEALRNLSFAIEASEFISLVGPSGCGKTTTLSLLGGLLSPTNGKIFIDGQELSGTNEKAGYMLQEDHLFPWKTIRDNVLLGLKIKDKLTPETKQRALNLLADYGLEDFAHHYPGQVSGGMRQRVALARTLAFNPDIVLLDEPFSELDYQTKLTLENDVANILREKEKTVILVTHDISEAIAISDRVLVFSQRPGSIKNEHKIELTVHGKFSTFKARKAVEFNNYFNTIWKELGYNG
jgi:NitT/TauT family transport system ATP-binding protein